MKVNPAITAKFKEAWGRADRAGDEGNRTQYALEQVAGDIFEQMSREIEELRSKLEWREVKLQDLPGLKLGSEMRLVNPYGNETAIEGLLDFNQNGMYALRAGALGTLSIGAMSRRNWKIEVR